MPVFTKRYHPPGTEPGTLHPHPAPVAPPRITVLNYDAANFEIQHDATPEDCVASLKRPTITWIHVQGTVNPELLHQLGDWFALHPLSLEDVLNTGQRPKAETFDDQLFVIASLPAYRDGELLVDQVSLFLGERYVVSLHSGPHDPFDKVRKRLQTHAGRLRNRGADYLLYALLDVVIDEGFPVLEDLGERIEHLEQSLLDSPGRETLNELHVLKRELLQLRRMLWPHRELVNELLRDEGELIHSETRPFLRDCYDHAVQIMDLLENYRDMVTGMIDIYLSSASNRLNETMRVLTVIATLFIPPTFVVGLYGMNFDRKAGSLNMPELGWPYGYLMVWGIIIALVGGMLWLFRRRKWF
jgi:magnesium transporter